LAWWTTGLLAALVGLVLTGVQIMEKLARLANPETPLVCDVSGTLSCSTVLDAWQSRVLGVPNAMVGMVLFTILGSALALSLLGSQLGPAAWRVLWGLSVVFALFSTWFMVQTALVIGAMCLWCAFITTAVLLLVLVMTRSAVASGAFGQGDLGRALTTAVRSGQDAALIVVWWLAIAAVLVFGLFLA